MIKILLLASTFIGNMASSAKVDCSVRILKESFPDAEFKMLTFAPYSKQEAVQAKSFGVEVIKSGTSRQFFYTYLRSILWTVFGKIGLRLSFLLNDRILREYANADIIIDTRGIIFSDFFPSWKSYVILGMQIHTARLLGKPFVTFSQDMGPFKNRINRVISRFSLKRINLIIVRGAETKKQIEALGINNKPIIRPDLVFALEPVSTTRVQEILLKENITGKPVIGVVASRQIERLLERMYPTDQKAQNKYTDSIARIIDNIVEKFNAQVLLIPNEINKSGSRPDDASTARRTYEKIKNRDKVMILATDKYLPKEVQGIIGSCEMIISSRYHSCLFSLSMCVPCMVISWGFKYNQIMSMMGQAEYVIDFDKNEVDEIQGKLEKLWYERDKVRAELAERMPFIKNSVYSCGKLVKQLLENKGD